jgi:hypothetical protein
MLRIHRLQQFSRHANSAMEEALDEIPLYRVLAPLNGGMTFRPTKAPS